MQTTRRPTSGGTSKETVTWTDFAGPLITLPIGTRFTAPCGCKLRKVGSRFDVDGCSYVPVDILLKCGKEGELYT